MRNCNDLPGGPEVRGGLGTRNDVCRDRYFRERWRSMLEQVSRIRRSDQEAIVEETLELLRFLVLRSRGGQNRARILGLLLECPRNAHDIALELRLNYGTVTCHLKRLAEAGLVHPLASRRYARPFTASPLLKRNPSLLTTLSTRRKIQQNPRKAPPARDGSA